MEREEKILQLIGETIDELNLQRGSDERLDKAPEALLFGRGGALDSLGFVNLVADLERRLEAEFGQWINLADEELLAREDNPFQSAERLAAHIEGLL